MHILHVSWEYPPIVYGGLGRHVHALTQEQARQGHHVSVLTQRPPGTAAHERPDGVNIIRVSPPLPEVPREPAGLVEWVRGLDTAMASTIVTVLDDARPDVVHAHDWVVTHTALAARRISSSPLVSTIHATEAGRHQGWVSGDISTHIHHLEFRLANASQRIITCSTSMRSDVSTLFDIRAADIDVIPNGIDLRDWSVPDEDIEQARQRWSPNGRLGVFVGRLEWEKGVHTLLDAIPELNSTDLRFVVAGTGTYEPELVRRASDLLGQDKVAFTGWLSEPELKALEAAADVIVVPSLYEPFGLVALEAGALGVPVVVAETGGLVDIVDGGTAGHLFKASDPRSLASAIDHALGDRSETAHRVAALKHRIETTYQWERIAQQTVESYEAAITEQSANGPRPLDIAVPLTPDQNLLAPSG